MKYVAVFDYIDKVLIVLSAAIVGVFIFLFVSVVEALIRITEAIFTIFFTSFAIVTTFSLSTGLIKKLFSITRNKKKKHGKLEKFFLAKSKLNSIETLVSEVLVEMEISHE